MNRRFFLALIPTVLAAGCGFQLRGTALLPFHTVYVEASTATYSRNVMAERLRTLLKTNGATITSTPGDAEIIVKLGTENRAKTILSLTGAGRVAEYRLEMKLTYQAHTPGGQERLPETEIRFIRDLTYDDSQYSAKSAEEDFLYQSMDEDAAQQIVRHLRRIAL